MSRYKDQDRGLSNNPTPTFDSKILPPQPAMSKGIAQAQLRFLISLMIRGKLVKIFELVGGVSYDGFTV